MSTFEVKQIFPAAQLHGNEKRIIFLMKEI